MRHHVAIFLYPWGQNKGIALPHITQDKYNTMLPFSYTHEAKIKEWLSKFLKKTGYQFVENWSGYQFEFVDYQFVGYQFVGYQ